MIKCLIVEDEIAGQTILSKKLNNFYPGCRIEAVIDNKEDALSYLLDHDIDLLFLDVQIKGGTGIEIIESLKQFDFETIFITAYKEYAIEALNNNASYYLLKPIHDKDFQKGMDIVLERIRNKRVVSTILVSHKNSQIPISVEDIFYFKSEGAYSYIHTRDEHFLSSKSIGYYEQLLSKTSFIRTHHSYLVNIKQIDRFLKGRSGTLVMSNGDEVPVAQRRINELMTILQV